MLDLILAGHAHGGQVRIPLLHQGLFAPQQGLFPRYTAGLHQYRSCAMVVSRGLGNPSTIPRMFNPPEIVVIELRRNLTPYLQTVNNARQPQQRGLSPAANPYAAERAATERKKTI